MGKRYDKDLKYHYKPIKSVASIIKSIFECTIDILFPRPMFCNGCGRQLKGEYSHNLCTVCSTYVVEYNNQDIISSQSKNINAKNNILISCYYEGIVKELIFNVKYKDKRESAITIAAYMADTIKGRKCSFDYIVPVPVSRRKLKKRGYNHVKIIADELEKLLNIPVNDCLLRVKDTKPQVLFNEQERWYNVKGCFKCIASLHGMHILLIDDLITTGATVYYCGEELKKSGVSTVTSLAFARSL